MPTSMVLRFRDLVEKTIIQHNKIISENGYVWWGWWSKPEERIPKRVFSQFRNTIKSEGGMGIFLVDSGTKTLYEAFLLDIFESATEEPIKCPEPSKTPTYYSTANYKAWWRIKYIKKISSEEVKNWSYDEVMEFLDDPNNWRFHNKRIFNLTEMLERRHRTIYFIRPFNSEKDRDHRVELIPSIGLGKFLEEEKVQLLPPVELADFVTNPIARASNCIVHLSDIHFSKKHHNFATQKGRASRSLATTLSDDLSHLCSENAPAAVIISGDLTWQGTEEEFELALDFLLTLESIIGLRKEHFIIIPGNHDIQWSQQLTSDYERDRKVDRDISEAEKNYKIFFESYFGFQPNEFLSMGRRYILGNYISVDIMGINSCRLEQRHFAGYGYVGLEQLASGAKRMGWQSDQYRTKCRIMSLHHHIVPVTPEAEIDTYDKIYSLSLDSGQLIYKALELGVDLCAHGHMHQPFTSSVSRVSKSSDFSPSSSFGIHGAGSAGAKREFLGGIGKNSYTVYRFSENEIQVIVRSYGENVNEFEKDWESTFYKNPFGGIGLTKYKNLYVPDY